MKREKFLRKTIVVFLTVMMLGTLVLPSQVNAAQIMNWSKMDGVIATSDCHDGALTPDKVIDGDIAERTSRWSSKNIWDTDDPNEANHETSHGHWIQLELPNEAKIHSVKIYWEQKNAEVYAIESSMDGENWDIIKKFNEVPSDSVQTIEFDEVVNLKYIRLRTEKMDTSDTHNPMHPYYQNVSLYEFEVYGEAPASKEINLSMMKGVKATASCSESNRSPEMSIDGEVGFQSKWSSHNPFNDDNYHSHWLQLEFPEVVKANSVNIVWEKANAQDYYLESSQDGENWTEIRHFTERPGPLPDGDTVNVDAFYVRQVIEFDESIQMKYIRIRVEDVCIDGDVNLYYQWYHNVVVSEFEVYGDDPDFEIASIAADIEAPHIITHPNGTRQLSTPSVPEGYTIELMGADFEQVIGDDGTVYPTIEDKVVTLGYVVKKEHRSVETEAFEIYVPATMQPLTNTPNARPSVSPEIAEWRGGIGNFETTKDSRIILGSHELSRVADEFSKDYEDMTGRALPVIEGNEGNAKAGDFYLSLSQDKNGLDKEGYFCYINDHIHLYGEEETGVYWGTRTLLQILKQNGTTIPQGQIRDYPKYEVRGFGIDVGRQTVSLDMLKTIAKTMSWYKMNDFHIHLNDNEILGYSGKIDSVENALTAYSGFRLESNIKNKDGVPLTSQDMFYTKEEFKNFIQDSRHIGMNIVPEFDSPAHSLAFTKVFPEYAFKTDPSHVDQIDLSVPGAVDLMTSLYKEYIDGDDPVFDNETTVHIGMDEYFGNPEAYLQYGNTLIDLLGERTVRLWGGLSYLKGSTKIQSENVQMNIWHTRWAKPDAMYDQGFGLINSQNGKLYIIPGGGWDYLELDKIYQEWTPNIFIDSDNKNITYEIPSYSKQMLGGSYTMWHDLTGNIDYGLTEYDDFDRFLQPIAVITEKLWANGQDKSLDEINQLSQKVGLSPSTNPYNKVKSETPVVLQYDFEDEKCLDSSKNEYHALENTATLVDGKSGKALDLSGNKTVTTPLDKIGPDARVSFWIKRHENASDEEQVLFEKIQKENYTFHDYQFKAVQKGTGQVGFSREHFDYSFNYTLPKGEWVYLTVECQQNITKLYVNGELKDTIGTNETWTDFATFPFPLKQIGSSTKGFEGLIDKLTVTDGASPCVNDKSQLEEKLKEAKEILGDIYTSESFKVLQDAIAYAQSVYDYQSFDALQIDIDNQVEVLQMAIDQLIVKDADYSELEKAMNIVHGLNKALYENFEAVEKAMNNIVKGLDITRQEEVDKMASDINEAIKGLVEVNYKDLEALYNANKNASSATFTEESWKAFFTAMEETKEVIEKKGYKQSEVDEVLKGLQEAVKGLKEKPVIIDPEPVEPTPTDPTPVEPTPADPQPTVPNRPMQPTRPNEPEANAPIEERPEEDVTDTQDPEEENKTPGKTNVEDTQVPQSGVKKTSGTMNIVMIGVCGFILFGGLYLLFIKRKKEQE